MCPRASVKIIHICKYKLQMTKIYIIGLITNAMIINRHIIIFTFAFYGILQILFVQNPIIKQHWLMGEAFVLLLVSWGLRLGGRKIGYVRLCIITQFRLHVQIQIVTIRLDSGRLPPHGYEKQYFFAKWQKITDNDVIFFCSEQ